MVAVNRPLLSSLLGLSLLAIPGMMSPRKIVPAEAKDHIGETATVCGKVVAASISKYGVGNLGWPISLVLEKPEASPEFIIGTLTPKRLRPEEVEAAYQGKVACATGKITQVRGVPQIITSKPSDIDLRPDASK